MVTVWSLHGGHHVVTVVIVWLLDSHRVAPVVTPVVVIVVTRQFLCGHCIVNVVTWWSLCGLTWSLGGSGITSGGHCIITTWSLCVHYMLIVQCGHSLNGHCPPSVTTLRSHCSDNVVPASMCSLCSLRGVTAETLRSSCDHDTVPAVTG